MITTRTPLRISLLGGGTDVDTFFTKSPGAVVSFAINKYVHVSVNKKFDNKFRVSYSNTENVETIAEIKHDIVRETLRLFKIETGLEITTVSDIPGNGTGLGSSSALAVGLIKALGRNVPSQTIAERAYVVEFNECGHPVGKQDQYASALGGMNRLVFHSKDVCFEPIPMHDSWKKEFEDHCMLLWTGVSRDGNEILSKQRKLFESGANLTLGMQLAQLTNDFYVELIGGADMKRIGEFLQEGWKIKKFFANGISNPKIESIYEIAMRYGAHGGKLLGAGGGGFLFFIAPPDCQKRIEEETGLRRIYIKIDMEGSKVVYES